MTTDAHAQGEVEVTTQTTTDMIATPGANATLHLTHCVIGVHTAAADAFVHLLHGSTEVLQLDATVLRDHVIDFGEIGYAAAKNEAWRIQVSGGNAGVTAAGVARVTGE
tara:strand:- start:213 stop:539 length:327 start_codon:yes stop_codon:yes gene_type:complete